MPSGGPRPGAGRPKGSPNKIPSKSAQARAMLAERLAPELDKLAEELVRIALTAEKDQDRIKAIQTAFQWALGNPGVLGEGADEDSRPLTVRDLMAFRDQEAA